MICLMKFGVLNPIINNVKRYKTKCCQDKSKNALQNSSNLLKMEPRRISFMQLDISCIQDIVAIKLVGFLAPFGG